MSMSSRERVKKQAFIVVLSGKSDLENSPLILVFFSLWGAFTSQQEYLVPFPRAAFTFPG